MAILVLRCQTDLVEVRRVGRVLACRVLFIRSVLCGVRDLFAKPFNIGLQLAFGITYCQTINRIKRFTHAAS